MATTKSAKLELWVYKGTFGNKNPSGPDYTITKTKIPTQSKILFEVGELIKDYIDVTFDGDYATIDQTAWVEWTITKTLSDATEEITTGSGLGLNGYGYFEDLINPQLSYGVLQSNTIMYVKTGDQPFIPMFAGGNGIFKVDYYNGVTLLNTLTVGNNVSFVTADTTDYKADTTKLTADVTMIRNASSKGTVGVASYTGSPSKVVLTDINNVVTNVFVYYIDECKYTPYRVSFLNKFGAVQPIYFFKRRNDYLDVKNEAYYRNTVDDSKTKLLYSPNDSTKKLFDINGNKRIKMNTGYVDEQYNEVIQQLLMTDRAWIRDDDGVEYPILPVTKSMQYKTSVNDKLIDFTIDFEYAYSEINLVR